MLLDVAVDYALDFLPQAQWGHSGIVVGYDLPGHSVHYEFGEVPWDFLHNIIFRIVECLGIVSKVLVHCAGVGSVYLRLFEEGELRSEFILDELLDVRVCARLLR